MTTFATRQWEAPDPDYEANVRAAFDAQNAMALLQARLASVGPGLVDIEMPVHEMVMSHIPGIVHGGTLGMLADSALGFSALTLAPPGVQGVTAEYKINILSPASGHTVIARGMVLKPGKKVITARADVLSRDDEREKLVATALGTLVVFG